MRAMLIWLSLGILALWSISCDEGAQSCSLGDKKCEDDRTVVVCSIEHEWFTYQNCGEGTVCGKNAAKEVTCISGTTKMPAEPDKKICTSLETRCLNRATIIQCEKDETKWKSKDSCYYDLQECDETPGELYYSATCAAVPCTRNELRCLPPNAIKKCDRNGEWIDEETCETTACNETFTDDSFDAFCTPG